VDIVEAAGGAPLAVLNGGVLCARLEFTRPPVPGAFGSDDEDDGGSGGGRKPNHFTNAGTLASVSRKAPPPPPVAPRVEADWQSACAILYDADEDEAANKAGAAPVVEHDVNQNPLSAGHNPHYLVASSFLRAGYSKNKLLARQATLLPSDGQIPMAAELIMLLCAREVSWLMCGTEVPNSSAFGRAGAPAVDIVGAMIGQPGKEIPLFFRRTLSSDDLEMLNAVRLALR